jgi:predicted metal-dependent TIM-barrel fold hydrolase
MAGIAAVVLSAGNPHVYRETYAEAPDAATVRRFWEVPIRLAPDLEKIHFFKVFVAVGISFQTAVRQWEQLIELLPEYLQKPHVVGLGEIGIDPVQHAGFELSLEEQKAIFEEQVRVAKKLDVPLMLHTPIPKKAQYHPGGLGVSEVLSRISREQYKRYFLDLDMEIINRVGLNHRRLVIDHADETIIEYALRETDAYVGISIGQWPTWRRTDWYFFADTVERYGPERLIVNTDQGANTGGDLLAIPRAIREMRRRGIDEQSIQRVVFDNANQCFSLDLGG